MEEIPLKAEDPIELLVNSWKVIEDFRKSKSVVNSLETEIEILEEENRRCHRKILSEMKWSGQESNIVVKSEADEDHFVSKTENSEISLFN